MLLPGINSQSAVMGDAAAPYAPVAS